MDLLETCRNFYLRIKSSIWPACSHACQDCISVKQRSAISCANKGLLAGRIKICRGEGGWASFLEPMNLANLILMSAARGGATEGLVRNSPPTPHKGQVL